MTRWSLFVCMLIFAAVWSACASQEEPDMATATTLIDPHSYSRPGKVAVKHIHLELIVDFDREELRGTATLDLERHDPEAPLILDTRDLTIVSVADDDEQALEYSLGDEDALLGRALEIALPEGVEQVVVGYSTSPQAGALQWLAPAQTSGESPFLFSQSQAILARTWVPCQDTPAVRFTYSADVQVPSSLLALMSAENPQQRNGEGRYYFEMSEPIPSYLLAIAVGDLEFGAIGDRTGVYAEPSVLQASLDEFQDVDAMMEAAERLYGPYVWGRYDILVLPPSFPFGGMENPRLTFATPTILAGDRSLVSLIAHELAHSWSGNLATNATWDDFWLNEGFTTYIELRLMEEIAGPEYGQMLQSLSFGDLRSTLEDMGTDSADSQLKLDLAGRDPDDGMTSIAYDKGALLLRTIESEVGRDAMDTFLKQWFSDNAFKPVTTDQFLAAFEVAFGDRKELIRAVREDWIHGAGLPAAHAATTADAFAPVDAALAAWNGDSTVPPWADWNTHQRLHFLRNLPKDIDAGALAALDGALALTDSRNSELAAKWLQIAIGAQYEDAYPKLREFLLRVGRRKFLSPLYRALAATDTGKDWAREVYTEARAGYHPVSQGSIDEILGWPYE